MIEGERWRKKVWRRGRERVGGCEGGRERREGWEIGGGEGGKEDE